MMEIAPFYSFGDDFENLENCNYYLAPNDSNDKIKKVKNKYKDNLNIINKLITQNKNSIDILKLSKKYPELKSNLLITDIEYYQDLNNKYNQRIDEINKLIDDEIEAKGLYSLDKPIHKNPKIESMTYDTFLISLGLVNFTDELKIRFESCEGDIKLQRELVELIKKEKHDNEGKDEIYQKIATPSKEDVKEYLKLKRDPTEYEMALISKNRKVLQYFRACEGLTLTEYCEKYDIELNNNNVQFNNDGDWNYHRPILRQYWYLAEKHIRDSDVVRSISDDPVEINKLLNDIYTGLKIYSEKVKNGSKLNIHSAEKWYFMDNAEILGITFDEYLKVFSQTDDYMKCDFFIAKDYLFESPDIPYKTYRDNWKYHEFIYNKVELITEIEPEPISEIQHEIIPEKPDELFLKINLTKVIETAKLTLAIYLPAIVVTLILNKIFQ